MDDHVPPDQTVNVNKDFADMYLTETCNSKILYGGKYLITYMIYENAQMYFYTTYHTYSTLA